MDRCWPKGILGDALPAISCAAGYDLRCLLRAIVRLGIGAVFFAPAAICFVDSNGSQKCHPSDHTWDQHLIAGFGSTTDCQGANLGARRMQRLAVKRILQGQLR